MDMKKIGVVGTIIENPQKNHQLFNDIVSEYKGVIKGRLGIPFDDHDMSVVTLTVVGSMDEINAFTGKLGSIPDIQVKTAISKKEID